MQTGRRAGVLKRPRVALPVVQEARVVVAFVEVLEHGGENLGLLVVESDAALAGGGEELLAARLGEPRRAAQNVLVGREQPLILANNNSDNAAVQLGRRTTNRWRCVGRGLVVQRLAHPLFGIIAKRALANLPRLARPVLLLRGERPLEHCESDSSESLRDCCFPKRVMALSVANECVRSVG